MAAVPEFQISQAIQDCPEALSIQVNQMVYDMKRAGKPLTVLSLGEAYFKIPMFDFASLNFEAGYHYSDSQGLPSLRDRIAGYYGSRYGARINGATEVLITAGSKAGIFLSMLTALNPGDEVLVHEPCWLSYPDQARLCRAVPAFVPYDVEPGDFPRWFSPRTRMLILNNPNNPAGRIYTRDELAALHRACRERGIYLMVDEAYSDFAPAGSFVSMASVALQRGGVIVVNSLSKNMGMSGWRIGYVIAEDAFIRQLLKANQHIITCAPTILQSYCDVYFDRILEVTLAQVRAVVDKRRVIAAMIDEVGLQRLGGDGSFYFFIGIGTYPGTSMDFAMRLLEREAIAVVPGSAYGRSTDRFVRIGIGTESESSIRTALLRIKAMVDASAPAGRP